MKKKLHISFLGFGILVLLLSQLITLLPAPRASAASLSIEDYSVSARKYSAYAAFHECLLQVPSGYKTQGTELGQGKLFSGLNRPGEGTGSLVVIGMINDIGNGDGTVFCDEAAQKWYEQAGYTGVDAMMKDLGFSSGTATSTCGGMATQTCTSTVWTLTAAPSVLTSNHTATAKSKNIPISLSDPGVKYSLAAAALQSSSCGAALTNATSAGANTVALLTDSSGTITYKTVDWGSTHGTVTIAGTGSTQVGAYPDPIDSRKGSTVSCADLVTYLNSTSGTAYFAAAMVAARVEQTASDFAKNACEKAGITDKKKLATCLKDFSGWAKECIKDYYTGNASSGGSSSSYSATFDVNVVANCVYGKSKSKYKNVTLEDLTGLLQAAMDGNTPADTTATAANDDPCSVLGDVQMRWLACALLTTGAGIAQTFYSIIQSLLYSPVAETFKSIDTPFKTFRLLGMALIVITGLIMIIAQATGSDLVDAYTVKKVLPKLGMALIGIALALPLLRFAVDLTNNLGFLVGDFIANVNGANNAGIAAAGSDGVGAGLIALVGAGGAVVAGYVYGLSIISFILIIAIGLLVGVVTLAIRQLVIVVLVLLAPLAIASYVLPGTDKLWKFWKNTLLTTLAMFPIIMLFIKSGVLMASIFGSRGDGFSTLMAALVYFAPYFMIPFAFKMAGGLMGNVFGMLNDRMKGAYNGLRSWRANTRKRRVADFVTGAKEGPKWFGTNPKTGRARDPIASMIAGAAQTYEGSLSLSKTGRDAYRAHRLKTVEDATKKKQADDGGHSTGDTDATKIAMHATSQKQFVDDYVNTYADKKYGGDRAAARAGALESMARLEGSLQTRMGTRQMQIAATRGRVAADNTSYFNDDNGVNKTEYSEIFGDVAQQVARGNISFMDGVSMIRENKNRSDLAGFSTGQTIELLQAAVDHGQQEGGTFGLDNDEVMRAQQYSYGSTAANSIAYGNPRVAKSMAEVAKGNLEKARTGKLIPLSQKTREQTQASINERAKEILTRTNAAAARDGSSVQPIDIAKAQEMAEREYRETSLIAEYEKLSSVQDSLAQAMPEIQDIYQQVLGQKIDLADFAGNKDFISILGITEDQINNHAEMTNADILERLRPHMNERRFVWGSGQEEAASHGQSQAPAEPARGPDPITPHP